MNHPGNSMPGRLRWTRTPALQSRDYWEESVGGYVAGAEPFTALFCADAVAFAEITPGVTLLALHRARRTGARSRGEKRGRHSDRLLAGHDQSPARTRARATDRCPADGRPNPPPASSAHVRSSGYPCLRTGRDGAGAATGGVAVIATANTPVGFGPNMVLAIASGRTNAAERKRWSESASECELAAL